MRKGTGSVCNLSTKGDKPGLLAVRETTPGSFVDCTITWARPLNKLRLQSSESGAHLSASWDDGSPLPRPIILPGPAISKLITFPAVGTDLPLASALDNALGALRAGTDATPALARARQLMIGTPVASNGLSVWGGP